jgi:hypothetical protein
MHPPMGSPTITLPPRIRSRAVMSVMGMRLHPAPARHRILQRGGVGRSDAPPCSLNLASMARMRSRSRSSSADLSMSSRNFSSRAAHCAGVGNLVVRSCLKGRRSFMLFAPRFGRMTEVPWWRNALTETVRCITLFLPAWRTFQRRPWGRHFKAYALC